MKAHLEPNQNASHGNSLISTSLLIFTHNYTFQTRRNRAHGLFCLNDVHCVSNHNVPNIALSILSKKSLLKAYFSKGQVYFKRQGGSVKHSNIATEWFNKG